MAARNEDLIDTQPMSSIALDDECEEKKESGVKRKREKRADNGVRAWCFTLNNFTQADVLNCQEIDAQYIVFQEETGESGTPHLQGYVYFRGKKTLSAAKKQFKGAQPHLEPARGTAADNRKYCTKEGGRNMFEHGEIPRQGARNDLTAIRACLARTTSLRSVLDECEPNFQGVRMAQVCLTLTKPKDRGDIIVKWFWGPTGSGKTRAAYEETGNDDDTYTCNGTSQWWDGYDGHSKVIIDDYRRDFCKFHELLKILDRYSYRVPVKGGYLPFNGRIIYITTPHSIADTWANRTEEDLAQLKRRVTEEREFSTSGDHSPEVGDQRLGVILSPNLSGSGSVVIGDYEFAA